MALSMLPDSEDVGRKEDGMWMCLSVDGWRKVDSIPA